MSTSCQSDGGQSDVAASPLALYPGSPEGHAARLKGTLEMDGGCLYIAGEGGERWLAAFPSPGTSWNPEDRSVRLGDKVLQVGARGGFGGGESKGGTGGISWVQAPGKECDGSKIWLVNSLVDP
ncbi:MAG: hypothetical protein ACJ76J_01480 [Thermoanaerobaculia bacterium]